MKRRQFTRLITLSSGVVIAPAGPDSVFGHLLREKLSPGAQVVIAGAGMGGCAAALALLRNGFSVILTEETDWIGGQLSSQGVPPDEHQWIESKGAPQSYRDFRGAVRRYYKGHYPVTDSAMSRPDFNPGDGAVSRLCHEPRVAVAVLMEMMAPFLSNGRLQLLLNHKIRSAGTTGDRITSVTAQDLLTGDLHELASEYFIDATELGDLLPLSGTENVTGAESREHTKELHALDREDPENMQAFTVCFAMDYIPGAHHVIDRPVNYDFWRNYIPDLSPPWSGRLLDLQYSNPKTLEPKMLGFHPEGIATGDTLNLWNYRRIIHRKNFTEGFYPGDITIVNWPQNDYMLGNLTGNEDEFKQHFEAGKQLSLSLFYWLQTEVPRPDGGSGWPGLRLRGDIMGTNDGMAKYPYVRESRRIKALFTVKEEHVGAENRLQVSGQQSAARFSDSVGVGYYHIDLHPSSGGNNYIDFASLPFQIPLGALLPERMLNLIPANKNIGTTHITNGCYRLHPVEWSIGEAAGLLVGYSLQNKTTPHAIYAQPEKVAELQKFLRSQGVETEWDL